MNKIFNFLVLHLMFSGVPFHAFASNYNNWSLENLQKEYGRKVKIITSNQNLIRSHQIRLSQLSSDLEISQTASSLVEFAQVALQKIPSLIQEAEDAIKSQGDIIILQNSARKYLNDLQTVLNTQYRYPTSRMSERFYIFSGTNSLSYTDFSKIPPDFESDNPISSWYFCARVEPRLMYVANIKYTFDITCINPAFEKTARALSIIIHKNLDEELRNKAFSLIQEAGTDFSSVESFLRVRKTSFEDITARLKREQSMYEGFLKELYIADLKKAALLRK